MYWETPALTAPLESLSDAVAWNGGFVAVGQLQTTNGGTEAAAWVSTDWLTWTRTLLDVPALGNSTLLRVVPVGSTLVAVGTSGVQRCVPPEGGGQVCDPLPVAVWTSEDGRTWRRAPAPTSLTGVSVADIASNAGRLILVGDTGWDVPGIWTSNDGITWYVTVNNPGDVWVTTSQEGWFTFVAFDPTLPTFAGHFAVWFGLSSNNLNSVMHDTLNIRATAIDGSGATLDMHAVDHISVSAKRSGQSLHGLPLDQPSADRRIRSIGRRPAVIAMNQGGRTLLPGTDGRDGRPGAPTTAGRRRPGPPTVLPGARGSAVQRSVCLAPMGLVNEHLTTRLR